MALGLRCKGGCNRRMTAEGYCSFCWGGILWLEATTTAQTAMKRNRIREEAICTEAKLENQE